MTSQEAYCAQCHQDREMVDTEAVSVPAGAGMRQGVKGACAVCGAGMFRFNEPNEPTV